MRQRCDAELTLPDAAATANLGAAIARRCPLPAIIYLEGDLGAGKTTLARGFLRGLGFIGRVKSPTYTLLELYELERCSVYHLDLYRLSCAEELEYLGVREYLHERAVWLVEWPQRGADQLLPADLTVALEPCGNGRLAVLRAVTGEWRRALQVPFNGEIRKRL